MDPIQVSPDEVLQTITRTSLGQALAKAAEFEVAFVKIKKVCEEQAETIKNLERNLAVLRAGSEEIDVDS